MGSTLEYQKMMSIVIFVPVGGCWTVVEVKRTLVAVMLRMPSVLSYKTKKRGLRSLLVELGRALS